MFTFFVLTIEYPYFFNSKSIITFNHRCFFRLVEIQIWNHRKMVLNRKKLTKLFEWCFKGFLNKVKADDKL